MLRKLPRPLQIFALSACFAAASSSVACSSDSADDPSSATPGSGGTKSNSTGSGNSAGEKGDGEGGEGNSGSGAEGGGDSSSGGTEPGSGGTESNGGRGGTESGSGGTESGSGGTESSGGTGGTGPDLEAIARGQELAEHIDVNCSGCHGLNYAGSPLYYAGNITPDVDTGIGSWSDVEIQNAVTLGIGKDGEELCSTMVPYEFDENQLRDLIAFLRSLTPVSKTLSGSCTD